MKKLFNMDAGLCREEEQVLTLDQAHVGETVQIHCIHDPEIAMTAIRLGLFEGEACHILSKVPAGPVVVRRGELDIALGRDLCRGIEIIKI